MCATDNAILREACTGGRLKVAQWLVATYPLVAEDAYDMANLSLRDVCESGDLETAQWLVAVSGQTIDDAYIDEECIRDSFRNACKNGHTKVAKWLAATFGLTDDDVLFDEVYVFRKAGARGHLETLQWLTDRFELQPQWLEEATIRYVLHKACKHEDLKVAQWLATKFDLSATRNSSPKVAFMDGIMYRSPAKFWRIGDLFASACRRGSLKVAQWLAETLEITIEEACHNDNLALRTACAGGFLEVAQWLTTSFGLTVEDVRADDNDAVRSACSEDHLPVVKWLVTRFGLKAKDLDNRDRPWGPRSLLDQLHDECRHPLARWLKATLPKLNGDKLDELIPTLRLLLPDADLGFAAEDREGVVAGLIQQITGSYSSSQETCARKWHYLVATTIFELLMTKEYKGLRLRCVVLTGYGAALLIDPDCPKRLATAITKYQSWYRKGGARFAHLRAVARAVSSDLPSNVVYAILCLIAASE
jgi:hypothetical protein